jgi:mannuronan 5-epimerase
MVILNVERSITAPFMPVITSILVTIAFSISLLLLPFVYTAATASAAAAATSVCINYDITESLIKIRCKSARLTDIDSQLNDQSLLDKQQGGVWLLNANLVVEKGSSLTIDSKDTTWLKIVSDETNPHGIRVLGSLKVDSVKITSWDPLTNDYPRDEGAREPGPDGYRIQQGSPRAFIRVENDDNDHNNAGGTSNITNSEIAYLGFEGGIGAGFTGLSYRGGEEGSVLRGNNIHHLYFGFYSTGAGNMVIEGNEIHHNTYYGLDPHTGTHDMIIRNNIVHDNGAMGIICSLDCYNILIENNEVYNNHGSGIMFSRNMYNSTARSNNVHNETQCIFVSQSHDNEIYNNTATDCKNAIYLKNRSFNNSIHDNIIKNPTSSALKANTGSSENMFHSNKIINSQQAKGIGNLDDNEKDELHGNFTRNTFRNNELM